MLTDTITLFYDIDGCFHPHGTAKFSTDNKVHRAPDDGLFVWAELMAPLLAEFPQLQLVCHSTWRNLYTLEELKEQLPEVLASRTVATTKPYMDRHKSITEFAENAGLTYYIMLDDDPWAFPIKITGLVLVPSETGVATPGAMEKLREAIALMAKQALTADTYHMDNGLQ